MSLGCRIYSSKYFEVSFETTSKTMIFWCVTPCGLVGGNLLSHLRKDVVTLATRRHTPWCWYCPRNTRYLRSQ